MLRAIWKIDYTVKYIKCVIIAKHHNVVCILVNIDKVFSLILINTQFDEYLQLAQQLK